MIFLLDGLHEDLNRVLHRHHIETRPEREAELEALSTQIASEQEWNLYRLVNNSLVVDYFQGQFRNRMECMTCHKVSSTFFVVFDIFPILYRHQRHTILSCICRFQSQIAGWLLGYHCNAALTASSSKR